MSIGERICYKVLIPHQTVSSVEKIVSKYLKSQSAESVKIPKGSNEIVYKSVFLKEVKTPTFLHFIVEQQGSNVGWTGFFLNVKTLTTRRTRPPFAALFRTYTNYLCLLSMKIALSCNLKH